MLHFSAFAANCRAVSLKFQVLQQQHFFFDTQWTTNPTTLTVSAVVWSLCNQNRAAGQYWRALHYLPIGIQTKQ